MKEKYQEYDDERCHNFVHVNGKWQHMDEFKRKHPGRWRKRGMGIMSGREPEDKENPPEAVS